MRKIAGTDRAVRILPLPGHVREDGGEPSRQAGCCSKREAVNKIGESGAFPAAVFSEAS